MGRETLEKVGEIVQTSKKEKYLKGTCSSSRTQLHPPLPLIERRVDD